MLWTIAVILFILWLLGTVTAYTASGLIHILLVLAVVVVLVNLITGRRAVSRIKEGSRPRRVPKAQSYMVLQDDKATCKNQRCRRGFVISGVKTMAFL